jgi:alpha-L-fucosidase
MKTVKVIEGLIKYIDKHVLPQMTPLQEVGYLTISEAIRNDVGAIEQLILNNVFTKMLFSADRNGEVSLERLVSGLRKVIAKKGSLTFNIPMYGNFTLNDSDITEILKNMTEEQNHEVNTQVN